MYFPTDPEENQDETTAVPAGLQKFNSSFAGFGVQPLPFPRLGLNGTPPSNRTMGPNQVANTATRQPDTTPKLSFAQRIAALGQYPFSESFSNNNQNAEGTPKVGIGHRIMGNIGQQPDTSAAARLTPLPNATPEMWRTRPQPLPALDPLQPARMELLNGKPSTSGFNNGQRYGEFFSGFVPAGAGQSAQRTTQPFQPRDGQQAFDFRGRPVSTLRFEQVGQQSPRQQTGQPQQLPSMLPQSPFLPGYLRDEISDTSNRLKQAADYLKWRDENFRPYGKGQWEAPSAHLYTNAELRDLYATHQQELAQEQRRREQERYAAAQARGRTVTITYPDGRNERRRGNHPQRDNNPGNMEAGSFSSGQGAVGRDKAFAVFPSAEVGWAAMDARLRSNKYWGLNIDDAIYKWAPPRNAKGQIINDTAGYQRKVRAALGVTGNTKISALTPEQFETLKQTIAQVEGFYEQRPGKKVDIIVTPPQRPSVIPRK